MRSADSLKLIERATSVLMASGGVMTILYGFIEENPWQIILPIIGAGLIVAIFLGLHKRPLRFVVGLQPQWFTIFHAILMSLRGYASKGGKAAPYTLSYHLHCEFHHSHPQLRRAPPKS